MPGQKPEEKKPPMDEEKAKKKPPMDEEAMKAQTEKAGKLETGLQSVKERLDSVLTSLKAGKFDDSVMASVKSMATDLGSLADAYPSPKSEKRDFTEAEFDDFVRDEIKAISSETDPEIQKERSSMLSKSIHEFRTAFAKQDSIEGTDAPAVSVTVWKDPSRQPDPTSTTIPATTPEQSPSVANVGKSDDGETSDDSTQSTDETPPGEGVQDDDPPKEPPTDEEDWGEGWDDMSKDQDPISKGEGVTPPDKLGGLLDISKKDFFDDEDETPKDEDKPTETAE